MNNDPKVVLAALGEVSSSCCSSGPSRAADRRASGVARTRTRRDLPAPCLAVLLGTRSNRGRECCPGGYRGRVRHVVSAETDLEGTATSAVGTSGFDASKIEEKRAEAETGEREQKRGALQDLRRSVERDHRGRGTPPTGRFVAAESLTQVPLNGTRFGGTREERGPVDRRRWRGGL